MFKKIATKITIATSALASASVAFARVDDAAVTLKPKLSNIDTETTVWAQIGTIINYFLTLVGLITFIFILYGGVILLTAQGNDEKVTEARKIILYSVAGAILIVLAYALNSWIFGSSFFVGGGTN